MATLWLVDVNDPRPVLAAAPPPDTATATTIATYLYPDEAVTYHDDVPLTVAAGGSWLCVGVYEGITVVFDPQFVNALPSEVLQRFDTSGHQMYIAGAPAAGTGAFGARSKGEVKRAFSATALTIDENIGVPLPFEGPFWAGEHPIQYAPGTTAPPSALPFNPYEFAEYANRAWLGFRYAPPVLADEIDPSTIIVSRFRIGDQVIDEPAAPAEAVPAIAEATEVTESAPEPAPEPAPAGRLARYFGFGPRR